MSYKLAMPTMPVVLDEDDPRLSGDRAMLVYADEMAPPTTSPVIGGAAQRIKFLSAGDLAQNGGKHRLAAGPPQRIRLATGHHYREGGRVLPVYPAAGYDWLRHYYRVLSTEPEHLIGCWPLWELTGVVARDHSGHGHNGLYTGVTLGQPGIGDGRTSPFFDGALDYVNIWSAALAAAFNGAEGTVLIWAKVANAGVWTDATTRRLFRIGIDANNYIIIARSTTNNAIQANYGAGGTDKARAVTVGPNLNFFCNCLTWSKSQDKVIFYINGVQQGATLTGLGAWAGVPVAANTVIGATSTVPANVFSGWLAHCALWSRALTATQIAYLSRF